jgi:hypothetical protein
MRDSQAYPSLQRPALALAVSLMVIGLLPLGACSSDTILQVKDPDIINPNGLSTPAGAAALYNGAIGDFTYANDGDGGVTEGQSDVSGMMADEWIDSETFPTRIEYDSRNINERNATLTGVFRNLQRARVSLENAVVALEANAPTPTSRIGETFALAGFTYVYFGENYCSGVPFSQISPLLSLGKPLATPAIFTLALQRFDSALADSGSSAIANLARIGKGRALVDLANFAAASAAVAAVPDTFKYLTFHSAATTRQQNGIQVFNAGAKRWSVADREGGNGLNFRSANDPRVKTSDGGVGFDNSTELWVLLKFVDRTAPVRVADGA